MEKKLGLSALTALVLSSMLGAGVFSLPQNMAAVASPAALLIGWGITGAGILLLVKLLQGATLQEALEHVTAAVYEIMVTTKAMQEYELQVVAAQDRIAKPEHYFSATKL